MDGYNLMALSKRNPRTDYCASVQVLHRSVYDPLLSACAAWHDYDAEYAINPLFDLYRSVKEELQCNRKSK